MYRWHPPRGFNLPQIVPMKGDSEGTKLIAIVKPEDEAAIGGDPWWRRRMQLVCERYDDWRRSQRNSEPGLNSPT
jgi:hypothetical protein